MYTEFERSLVLHPRLKYETRRESGAKIAISLLNEQELQNSGLKPSARVEILLSQRPQDASSVCKADGQVPKSTKLASREVYGATFKREMHQLRLQEKIQMTNLFKRYQNSNLVGLKMSWQTGTAYPQRPLLRVELSASKRGHKRCSRRRFLLLKSLDSGNLLKRPNRSMKALGHLRP